MQINIEYELYMQQITFRDRKYLHVELIGLRVCPPEEATVIAASWNRVETAPSSQYAAVRLFTVTEV